MVDAANSHPLRQSLQQQADLLDRLIARCVNMGGALADETRMVITKEEADHLLALSNRLHLISPFEAQIRKLVTGR